MVAVALNVITGAAPSSEFHRDEARSVRRAAHARKAVKSSADAPVGHTYIIAYPEAGVVKIGQAVYYAERVEQVRNMSPVETEVVCAFVGLHHERDLHKRFAHLRRRGEFFEYTDELRDYLASRLDAMAHEEAIATCRYTRNHPKAQKTAGEVEGA